MKRILFCLVMLVSAFCLQAQRAAVLEFNAGVGINQSDVDGISAIFITYFRPTGYTMVERTQIDRVIDEQHFQRGRMTESQMVRIGEILNVSKIVVGDVNVVMGQYNVDVRVLNVETGTIAATEGATFSGTSYRTSMQGIAQKLAAKIAISQGAPVPPAQQNTPVPPAQQNTPVQRTKVEVIYGYLKVFPNEIGVFDAEPTTVISHLNEAAQHGYDTWRIPTNEELSLIRANGLLRANVSYMTKENRKGTVLLVTDKEDAATLQRRAEEQARRQAEEQARKQAEKQALLAQGWVDLGLPSGTLWRNQNETGFFTYEEAVNRFGNSLPTKEQLEELKNKCTWTWRGNGYKVVGPNGTSMTLPAAGYRTCSGGVYGVGSHGTFWSSTPDASSNAWYLDFESSYVRMYVRDRCCGQSVRLVR